jgi:hypothetical protein
VRTRMRHVWRSYEVGPWPVDETVSTQRTYWWPSAAAIEATLEIRLPATVRGEPSMSAHHENQLRREPRLEQRRAEHMTAHRLRCRGERLPSGSSGLAPDNRMGSTA